MPISGWLSTTFRPWRGRTPATQSNLRRIQPAPDDTIHWYHRALVGYKPETDAGHALLMQALKRLSKPVVKKHPLTGIMLRGIFDLLDMSQSGHQLVWDLLLIGYFFLLRCGEFLKVDGKWKKNVLLFGDAQFNDGNERPCKVRHATMVGIVLRGGKNNQFGRNEIRYQFATGDPLLCPVRGLARIRIANRAHKTQPREPIARASPNHGVENGHIVQLLKEVATTLGLNPSNYSTQIRIGGSTALLNSGANPLVINCSGDGCQIAISHTPC
jgi:hypothetical protein